MNRTASVIWYTAAIVAVGTALLLLYPKAVASPPSQEAETTSTTAALPGTLDETPPVPPPIPPPIAPAVPATIAGAVTFTGQQAAATPSGGGGRSRPAMIAFISNICPICAEMTPIVDKLGREFASTRTVRRLNSNDKSQKTEAVRLMRVYGVPTEPAIVMVNSSGGVNEIILGAISESDLRAKLKALN